MKETLKKLLPKKWVDQINEKRFNYKAYRRSNNLTKLALIHHSDKAGAHLYTAHYQEHFQNLKNKPINLLEIGVGGYDKPGQGGNSLRMWKDFFKNGRIYGIDIHDKSKLKIKRTKIYKGDQTDKQFLDVVVGEIAEIDIIIDDGSHINDHIIKTFNHLFPKLKIGGWYVVEDLQTSYWSEYGGSSTDFKNSPTAINYFKSLTDGLNHSEFLIEGFKANELDKNIVAIYFYHNMVFIKKGQNNEPSNYVINNRRP